MVDRFRHLFDSLVEQVVVVDRDLRITYANSAWIRRTGLEPELILGQPCHLIVHHSSDPCTAIDCAVRRVFDTGEPVTLISAVGSPAHPFVSASPIRDATGRVSEVVQISHAPTTDVQDNLVHCETAEFPREADLSTVSDKGLDQVFATTGIENTRLLEAERTRSPQLHLLRELSQRILSILDPNDLLDYAVSAIQKQFGYYHVDVFLVDPSGEFITFAASSNRVYTSRWRERGLRFRISKDTGSRSSGIMAHVAATATPYVAHDVRSDPLYIKDRLLTETLSELAVPIQVGDRVVGILDFNSNRVHAFDEHDVFTAQSLADQLALGLENARLHAAADRRFAELEAVRRASLSLTSSLELSQVLETILDTSLDLIPNAQDAHVFLYQPSSGDDRDRLVFGAARWADGQTGMPWALPRENGLTYTVARTAETIVVPDMRTHSLYQDAPAEWSGAIVGLPLKIGRRVVGVMSMAYHHPSVLSDAELRVLELLADQAAVAIENARLHQETEQRLRELALLFDTSAALSTSLDMDTVALITAQQITRALQAQGCAISLWHPDEEILVTLLDYSTDPSLRSGEAPGVIYEIQHYPASRHVLTAREPIVVQAQDPASDPAERRWMHEHGVESLLMVPMVVRDKVVGLFELMELERARDFARTEISLCQTLANQAAAALENARLFRETEIRAREMAALASVGQAMMTLELDDVLDNIAHNALEAVHAEISSVYLLDAEQQLLIPRSVRGLGSQDLGEAVFRLSEGTIGYTAATGQALALSDTAAGGMFTPKTEEAKRIRNTLTVPLIVKKEVIGTLEVCNKIGEDAFTTADRNLLGAFAAQAAVAIDNARLYQQVSHHLEDVQILNKVAQAVTSTLDFDLMVRRAVDALIGTRHFERVNILLVDEERQDLWLHPALAHGTTPPARNIMRIPLGHGITGWVAQTGQPARVTDVDGDPRYLAGYPDTRAEMCVPLRAGNRVIGVLDVQSNHADAFSTDDERLLNTVASQLSTVIENARLFVETRQRVRELTAIMQVSQALNEAQGLEKILDIILQETFSLIGSGEGTVILIDPPGGNQLRIVAAYGMEEDVIAAFNSRPVYTHEGTYRRALEAGKIVEVSDTSLDEDFLTDVGSRARAVTNIPLLTDKGPIGLIAVDGLPGDDTSRRLLTTLASMAAVAIDKERLHQETAHRLSEVSTLYTLAAQITTSLSMRAVLDSIVSILRMTLDCRSCSIFLIDATGEYLQLETGSGPSASWRGIARLRMGEGISGQVVAERRSIYVPNTETEPDFIFFDPQIRSLLVVPLVVRNKAIGTLSIDDTKPHAFDEELRLLTIAAAQAAVAIENAQLYESLQKSYSDLEQAYDELRELDKMKSELIQNISHELRTPLTFIKGYVELLLDGEMGAISDDQHMALDIVSSKADALSNLVDDIISMQEIGRGQLQLEVLSLDDVAATAVRSARVSAEESGLVLIKEEDGEDPSTPRMIPMVRADRRRIGQVFDNLLQNAIKFSNPGDSIVVRVRNAGDSVRVEVEDSGIGIPQDQLGRIFERFYQVDGTTTRRFGGTGLGLAIVKQIVESHGGQVGVESEIDKGSLFYFTIPAVR